MAQVQKYVFMHRFFDPKSRYETKIKKPRNLRGFFCLSFPVQKLLLAVLVSLVEFVDAAGCVNKLDFASVEWVRCVGDLDLYDRILNAVNNDGLFCLGARACYEHSVVRHILESYKAVGFGMKSFFHFLIVFKKLFFFC